MTEIQFEIQGKGATIAATEVLKIEGLEGQYHQIEQGLQREGTIITIATIVAITSGSITIAEKIVQWYKKWKRPQSSTSIDKVILIGRNGRRILLKNASVKSIKEILDA